MLEKYVTRQIVANVCSVRTVRAGKRLFPGMDYHVAAQTKLELMALERFTAHCARGAALLPRHFLQGRHQRRAPTVPANSCLQQHTASVSQLARHPITPQC